MHRLFLINFLTLTGNDTIIFAYYLLIIKIRFSYI